MGRSHLIQGRASGRHRPVTPVIDILRDEHRNIEKLLLVLEQELGVFNRAERPDYHVVQSVIEYFQDYPDCCHHPKEDMVFEKLKARDPVTAASIGDLEAEHEKGSKRLGRVARTVESVLADREILRQTVDTIIRDFIDHERQHMAMEERVLFPAALRVLLPQDWAEIRARLTTRKDPLGTALEAKYSLLRHLILQWEQEAESERIQRTSSSNW
jgi:hemerythrin-like domain-containing protein